RLGGGGRRRRRRRAVHGVPRRRPRPRATLLRRPRGHARARDARRRKRTAAGVRPLPRGDAGGSMKDVEATLSRGQEVSLVLLRTLVGWHFLYEGYFKLLRPAWSRDGAPLAAWTSAGYLHAANGPFAGLFHRLADAAWIGRVDTFVAAA